MKDISLVANMPLSTNANMTHREIYQSPHRLSKHPRTVSLSTGMLEITSLVCSILTTIAITNSFHMTININCRLRITFMSIVRLSFLNCHVLCPVLDGLSFYKKEIRKSNLTQPSFEVGARCRCLIDHFQAYSLNSSTFVCVCLCMCFVCMLVFLGL